MNIKIWRRRGLAQGKYQSLIINARDLVQAIDYWKNIELLHRQPPEKIGRFLTVRREYVNHDMLWDHLQSYNILNAKATAKMSFYDTNSIGHYMQYHYEDPLYVTSNSLENEFQYAIESYIEFKRHRAIEKETMINPSKIIHSQKIAERYINFLRYLAKK